MPTPQPEPPSLKDLEGNPLKVFDRAYEPGEASLSIGGRAVTSEEWAAT